MLVCKCGLEFESSSAVHVLENEVPPVGASVAIRRQSTGDWGLQGQLQGMSCSSDSFVWKLGRGLQRERLESHGLR